MQGRKPTYPWRINGEITAPEVRLVGLEPESRNGVYTIAEAIGFAKELEQDLVEIAPNQSPPVCKIVEFSKFRFEQKKREKEQKSKQHAAQMKEIRFGPNTDEHDFNFKLKHAQKFLTEGNKVKAYVHFFGRSIVYADRGEKILLEFAQALENEAKVEAMPKLEGKRMHLILAPKAAGKAKK